jgi:hypothetical protein
VGLAVFGAFMIPILTAYSNIITSKMKGMHENTISCYLNPSIGLFSLVIIIIRWEFDLLYQIILKLEILDWILIVMVAFL